MKSSDLARVRTSLPDYVHIPGNDHGLALLGVRYQTICHQGVHLEGTPVRPDPTALGAMNGLLHSIRRRFPASMCPVLEWRMLPRVVESDDPDQPGFVAWARVVGSRPSLRSLMRYWWLARTARQK